MSLPRKPVCAYSAEQSDKTSSIEVVVCDDGTCWTLTEDAETKVLAWSMDGVPPIPGTWHAMQGHAMQAPPAAS